MLQNGLKVMTAAAILGMVLAGCGHAKMPAQGPASEPAKQTQGSGSDKPSSSSLQPPSSGQQPPSSGQQLPSSGQEQQKQAKVKIYFGDDQMNNLVEKEATITYKQDSDKYLAVLKAQAGNGDAKTTPLFKGFTFKTATLKDGLLTVDLSMAPEARLGSGGEELILSALQRSLFQFPEVQSINILVDGKQEESLMGHMDLPHPIKRSTK
ncbi:GerMN domain-containing protein [Paenibacillus filicis]|uniref:GerMN domain-containing protein n=1 Tax=Paenibacillus gyeongsangnamensis TaxID=3388067 RepID=A0ABT4Q878_9BACL|nr:GerMN domain-containing protein [Paenibacillus filicis]MCZ8512992.1 GerMN domain-containing protein [Paenibacillus filicis]